MSLSPSSTAINRILAAHGFTRQRRTWYRDRGDLADVVDVQLSPIAHDMTLNVGVLDREVHQLVWGRAAPEFFDEVNCVVRVRVGQLLDEGSGWWKPRDPDTPEELERVILERVLPFLDQLPTRASLLEQIQTRRMTHTGTGVARWQHAALTHLAGNTIDARRLLDELARELPSWADDTAQVRARIDRA